MTFNVKYGIDTHPVVRAIAPTVGQVKQDTNLKLILGFGDNQRALVNGVEIPDEVTVPEGCTLVLETKANEKA